MEIYQIHKAALDSDYENAIRLINSKVDLNELDTNGHTPLHWAVFKGDIDFVKLLLKAGANPNVFSSDGVTPSWRARDFMLIEIERLLVDFGGKVLTNKDFDRTSSFIFNDIIGQPESEEDRLVERDTIKKKWWRFW